MPAETTILTPRTSPADRWGYALTAVGTFFSFYVGFVETAINDVELTANAVGFLLTFVCGPWLLLAFLQHFLRRPIGVIVASALWLILELLSYYSVFIAPKSSTAALAYAVKPLLQLFILLPLALLVAHPVDRKRPVRT